MFKSIIVSAPFGNHFGNDRVTRTFGTFTLNYRGGKLYRLWRMLRTLRYSRRLQGWINKLGLPNPGIASVDGKKVGTKKNIVSIHGFSEEEWYYLIGWVGMTCDPLAIELNLSCPNVDHKALASDVVMAVRRAAGKGTPVIAKLPPVRWMDLAFPLYAEGVRIFHCCNTIPTPGGGLSGKVLKQYSLWAVEEIKDRWGDSVKVIGGGGITSAEDIEDYRKAGADHVAVGSMLLNPLNRRRFYRMVEKESGREETENEQGRDVGRV